MFGGCNWFRMSWFRPCEPVFLDSCNQRELAVIGLVQFWPKDVHRELVPGLVLPD